MDYIYYADVLRMLAGLIAAGFAIRLIIYPCYKEYREEHEAEARRSAQLDHELDSIAADYEKHFSKRP
jgi:hypothetical protein